MSGGSLCDYNQRHIIDMCERIKEEMENNEKLPYENPLSEWEEQANKEFLEEGGKRYSDETIIEFYNAIQLLKKAYIYAHRIDWLLSGDDSEESFHERLKEDFDELMNGECL